MGQLIADIWNALPIWNEANKKQNKIHFKQIVRQCLLFALVVVCDWHGLVVCGGSGSDSGSGSGGSGDVNEQRVNDLRGVIVNSSRVAKQTRKLHKNFKCVRID